jgi:hypothetical protein
MAKKKAAKKARKGNAKKAGRRAGSNAAARRSPTRAGKKAKKATVRGRRPVTKKPASRSPQPNPFPVGTGSAPSAAEVGQQLIEMFNRGELRQIEDQLWAPEIVSVEGMGMGWRGRKAVDAKNADWNRSHRIHGGTAEGPYTGATGFAVKFLLDIEDTTSGKRTLFEEVGVYKVRNGKVVEEEFMYGRVTPVG